MKNDKENSHGKSISQPAPPDTAEGSGRQETPTPQSPNDLAARRKIFIDLFTSTPEAWGKVEATTLGEKSREELAAKRDIFIGLMSGVAKAWEKIEPRLPARKQEPQSDNQSRRQPSPTTDTPGQEGAASVKPTRRK